MNTIACEIAYRDEPENQFWVNIVLGSCDNLNENDNGIFFFSPLSS